MIALLTIATVATPLFQDALQAMLSQVLAIFEANLPVILALVGVFLGAWLAIEWARELLGGNAGGDGFEGFDEHGNLLYVNEYGDVMDVGDPDEDWHELPGWLDRDAEMEDDGTITEIEAQDDDGGDDWRDGTSLLGDDEAPEWSGGRTWAEMEAGPPEGREF